MGLQSNAITFHYESCLMLILPEVLNKTIFFAQWLKIQLTGEIKRNIFKQTSNTFKCAYTKNN